MKPHEKLKQLDSAINNAKLALAYLREARREAFKVHEDERATRLQSGIARSHLREADEALAMLSEPYQERRKTDAT